MSVSIVHWREFDDPHNSITSMTISLRTLTLTTLVATSVVPLHAGAWWPPTLPVTLTVTKTSFNNALASAQPQELDALMERVLQRRDINWRELYDYVFSELESVQVDSSAGTPVAGYLREYHWFVREGYLLRSPVRLDGVEPSPEFRATYESKWFERERLTSVAPVDKVDARAGSDGINEDIGSNTDARQTRHLNGNVVTERQPQPRSELRLELGEPVEREYFLGLNFEPGNYFFAGKEKLENRDVLRIEYYPSNMFASKNRPQFWERRDPMKPKPKAQRMPLRHDGNTLAPLKEQTVEPDRVFGLDQDNSRRFNVTTMVTLWVDQAEEQIVKVSMENVSTEFLNISWLLRIEDVRASMTMGEPLEGVWLPQEIEIVGTGATAEDSYELVYRRVFFDYKRTDVEAKVRYRIPRSPR